VKGHLGDLLKKNEFFLSKAGGKIELYRYYVWWGEGWRWVGLKCVRKKMILCVLFLSMGDWFFCFWKKKKKLFLIFSAFLITILLLIFFDEIASL